MSAKTTSQLQLMLIRMPAMRPRVKVAFSSAGSVSLRHPAG
jgi:hypothetical protein